MSQKESHMEDEDLNMPEYEMDQEGEAEKQAKMKEKLEEL